MGSASRWLESSFTDQTSHLSTLQARDKFFAAAVLRRAGLPVPRNQRVNDEKMAVKVAQKLGYPVVVKPVDLDGGVGVAAGLQSASEVEKAYRNAASHSSKVMVEKHIVGRDYRLTVLHGELLWAIERVPAGVVGDGEHTVGELVDMVNRDPERGDGRSSPLRLLKLDGDATDLLGLQDLAVDEIPPNGHFVRLHRTANVANGGVPVAAKDQVHEDNRRLAERAARIFRLDIAGIDLIIPDIGQSWLETGGAICEINSQPSLGRYTTGHLYTAILQKLLPGNGRIPILLIVGEQDRSLFTDLLLKCLADNDLMVGFSDGELILCGNQRVSREKISAFAGGTALLDDLNVDALVLSVNDDALLDSGLPFDRFDALIIADEHFKGNMVAHNAADSKVAILAFVEQLAPALTGKIYFTEAVASSFNAADFSHNDIVETLTADPRQAVDKILKEILA